MLAVCLWGTAISVAAEGSEAERRSRVSLLNTHRSSRTSPMPTGRKIRVATLLNNPATKFLVYQYNGGRLNNQLHSLSYAFRLSKEVGRPLYLPEIRRTHTDWLGIHSNEQISTWDMDKLAEKFDFVTWTDVALYPESPLAKFVNQEPEKSLYSFSQNPKHKDCFVGWPGRTTFSDHAIQPPSTMRTTHNEHTALNLIVASLSSRC